MSRKQFLYVALIIGATFLLPQLGYCDVEGTLGNIRDTLITKLMPLAGVLGLCWASFSFFMGNPNARARLWLAIIGALIGFGAPSIIDYVKAFVN